MINFLTFFLLFSPTIGQPLHFDSSNKLKQENPQDTVTRNSTQPTPLIQTSTGTAILVIGAICVTLSIACGIIILTVALLRKHSHSVHPKEDMKGTPHVQSPETERLTNQLRRIQSKDQLNAEMMSENRNILSKENTEFSIDYYSDFASTSEEELKALEFESKDEMEFIINGGKVKCSEKNIDNDREKDFDYEELSELTQGHGGEYDVTIVDDERKDDQTLSEETVSEYETEYEYFTYSEYETVEEDEEISSRRSEARYNYGEDRYTNNMGEHSRSRTLDAATVKDHLSGIQKEMNMTKDDSDVSLIMEENFRRHVDEEYSGNDELSSESIKSRCKVYKKCIVIRRKSKVDTEDEVHPKEELYRRRERRQRLLDRMKRNDYYFMAETKSTHKKDNSHKPDEPDEPDVIVVKQLRPTRKKKSVAQQCLQEIMHDIVAVKNVRQGKNIGSKGKDPDVEMKLHKLMASLRKIEFKQDKKVRILVAQRNKGKTPIKRFEKMSAVKEKMPVKDNEQNPSLKRKKDLKTSAHRRMHPTVSMTETGPQREGGEKILTISLKERELLKGKTVKSDKENRLSSKKKPPALFNREKGGVISQEGKEVVQELCIKEKTPEKDKKALKGRPPRSIMKDTHKQAREKSLLRKEEEKEKDATKIPLPDNDTVKKRMKIDFVKDKLTIREKELSERKSAKEASRENKIVTEKGRVKESVIQKNPKINMKKYSYPGRGLTNVKDKPEESSKAYETETVSRDVVALDEDSCKISGPYEEESVARDISSSNNNRLSGIKNKHFGDVCIMRLDSGSLINSFRDYVTDNHSLFDTGFRIQFLNLDSGGTGSTTIGMNVQNMRLNRYKKITVYNHNRIVLHSIPGVIQSRGSYINASYIEGYLKSHYFIATQDPLPDTVIDFWRMVWQEKVPTIVMLTNLNEGAKELCAQYWPNGENTMIGPFILTLTDVQIFADYCVRTILISLKIKNTKPLNVKQYHFTSWLRSRGPDFSTIQLFHKTVIAQHDTSKGPIVVHCSSGVGNTGVFICINNVLEEIKHKHIVDITGTISKMRCQRMKMVQNLEQYIYIHDMILEYLTCGETQIESSDIGQKLLELTESIDQDVTKFEEQFEVLNQVSTKVHSMVCSVALKNISRNRTTDYLPADIHRVSIKDEDSNYIHASYVKGYRNANAFIVAEGPMESTVRDMWKIIYDSQIGAIVMLSDLVECGMESSYQYWPKVEESTEFGEYKVHLMKETKESGLTIRKLSVYERKKVHNVVQFHITCWEPDGKCSDLRSVIKVINKITDIQRETESKPIWIHCSDTVTRSGIFCALATVIDCCKMERVVDVFQTVKMIRSHMPGAVPNIDHYKMIFDGVLLSMESNNSDDALANNY